MDQQGISETHGAQAGRYLTFALSSERYGVGILKVQEIIGISSITRVPKCPNYIKGVINLRGKIIPLVDLRLKFGMPPLAYSSQTCVIVVNLHREEQVVPVGVIVDTVLEVINFSGKEIEPAPNYGAKLDSQFIVGMGRKENGDLNILIDIESSLSHAEISAIERASK